MFEGIKRIFKKKNSNINSVSLTVQSLEDADLYRQGSNQEGIDPSTLEGQSLVDIDLYNVNEQEETVKHR